MGQEPSIPCKCEPGPCGCGADCRSTQDQNQQTKTTHDRRIKMAPLVNQPSALPTRKVIAGVGGAIVTLAAFFFAEYLGYEMSGELIAAATVVVSAVLAYFVRNEEV